MRIEIATARTATWTGALAVLALALGAASPAQAGRFGDGFEDELGRIAAHAAVGAGVHLLHHATAPHYVETHVVHRYPRPHYRPHYRPHPPRHGHWKHRGHRHGHWKHRGHRHHYRHDHRRGYPPCEIDHRVTVERRSHYSYSRY